MKHHKHLIALLLVVYINTPIAAQHHQIDFGFGVHFSKFRLHHPTEVKYEKEGFTDSGFQFMMGATSKIKNKFLLRTELGYCATNSFIIGSYSFDEGFGIQKNTILSWLNHQRIYFGLLPEYRDTSKKFDFYINGGLLVCGEVTKNLTSNKEILLPKYMSVGFRIGTGFIYKLRNLGLKYGLEFSLYSRTQLYNRYHPYISYNQISNTFGIVYYLE